MTFKISKDELTEKIPPPKPPPPPDTALQFSGNIDQESLENITKIDLGPKKKKKQAQDPEITSQNKKKIIMPKKASIFVKSKKTKEQHLKELEEYELQMQSFNRKKGVTEEEYRKHTSIK